MNAKNEPTAKKFPPIEDVTSPAVSTEQAAYYLNRRPQTLRVWSCLKTGPLEPSRINGRMAWKVSDLKRLLGVEG